LRKTLVLAGAFAALLAVLAAGCGGGGGGGGLSKDEYVSRLNAICEDFNAKQEEIGEPQNLSELGTKGEQLLAEFDNAIDDVKGLGDPPDEIADQANRFIAVGEEERDLIRDLIDAANDNDQARVQELGSQIEPLDNESDRLATELGANACAGD
jgi:hypothetical protein